MMWWNDGMGWGGWIAMTLIMVAFWSLVIFAVVAIFRGDRDSSVTPTVRDRDPLGILDERFARGDIDAEEYRARRNELGAVR